LNALDRYLLLALRNPADLSDPIGPAWLQRAAVDITALGGHTVLVLLVLAAAALLLLTRRREDAAWLLGATAGAMLLNHLLKAAFARARPDLVDHLVTVVSPSFPSGHALMSAAFYLTLAGLLGRAEGVRTPIRRSLLGLAVMLVVLIGLSRVYLGVHWPSDVLGGWSLGALWALGCVRLASRKR
jgi:undecaprenyl-diphosphatase